IHYVVPVTSYDVAKNEGTTRLWLGRGAELRPLTGEVSASQPALCPDGMKLAFVRKAPADKDANGAEKNQLWLMPLDGGEPIKLTDLPLGVSDPHWFPDGKRIAFLSPLYEGHWTLEATAAEAKRRKDSKVKAKVSENRFYRYWDRWVCEEPFQHIFVLDLQS